jgi:class 3 adenylate cyclase
MHSSSARKALDKLLDQRNERPEQLHQIDAEIKQRFGETHTVFVLDMSGFSARTLRYGISHYLAMIRRMHTIVLPLVARANGRVVKTEADNVFALFSRVPDALEAAAQINEALARVNAGLPADWDILVGIGIGHGPLLVIGKDDVFGSEMNLASKLGEDIANGGEVLLTENAAAKLPKQKRDKMKKKVATFSKHKQSYYVAMTFDDPGVLPGQKGTAGKAPKKKKATRKKSAAKKKR